MARVVRDVGRLGLGLILAVATASASLAQTTTGSVAGTVRDESGAALPGVTVTISGSYIVGMQEALSNDRGFYRFLGLPPGLYEMTFALAGFQQVKRSAVRVSVGGTTEESVSLAVSAVTEQVEVVASAPVVDTSTNQVSTNLNREWIDRIPTRRQSFFDLAAAAPGSLGGGEGLFPRHTLLFAYGSSEDENSFQIDGTEIGDALAGGAFVLPNPDAIEEMQVLSLGAPAEYGGRTGAVYNIVTRQGTNDFHGDANVFVQTAGLTGDNTTDIPPLADGSFVDSCPTDEKKHCPFRRDQFADVSFQLGGPIRKDRLWFLASYQHQADGATGAGLEVPPGIEHARKANRYLLKLNFQLNPRHRLQASLHYDDEFQPHVEGPAFALSNATAWTASKLTPALAYHGVLSDHTVVEVRYSGFYGNVDLGPLDPDQPRDLPHVYNLDTGHHSGGFLFWYAHDRSRSTVSAKVSHLSDDFLGGSHDFRFGVQYYGASTAGMFGNNDFLLLHYENGVGYGYGTTSPPQSYSGDARGIAAFADDTFRVSGRLSLNLGLRYAHDKGFSGEHPQLTEDARPTGVRFPQEDQFSWNTLSPRIGFNWKATADGKTVLRGHWGRYHRGVLTGEWQGVVETDGQGVSYRGTVIPGTLELTDLVPLPQNRNRSIDPGYRAPYADQWILSAERELWAGFGVQVSYVYKRGRRYPAWRDFGGVYREVAYVDDQGTDATGRTVALQELQNAPEDLTFALTNRSEMDQDLHAATVAVTKRMSGRWLLNASLSWLRATGRSRIGNTSTLIQNSGAQFSFFGSDPNDFVNTGGRMVVDVPLQAKAQVAYRFSHGVSASMSVNRRSGAYLDRRLAVGELTQGLSFFVLAEERGRLGRLPALTFVDLRVQKDFRLRGNLQLGVFGDLLNAFDDHAHQWTVSDLGTSPDYHVATDFVLPRRLMLGAKLRF